MQTDSKTKTELRKNGYVADVQYYQADGIDVDGIDSKSHEVLYHELNHAEEIVDGTTEKESNKYPPGEVEKRAEIRATKNTNRLRKRNGRPQRKQYTNVNKVYKMPE